MTHGMTGKVLGVIVLAAVVTVPAVATAQSGGTAPVTTIGPNSATSIGPTSGSVTIRRVEVDSPTTIGPTSGAVTIRRVEDGATLRSAPRAARWRSGGSVMRRPWRSVPQRPGGDSPDR